MTNHERVPPGKTRKEAKNILVFSMNTIPRKMRMTFTGQVDLKKWKDKARKIKVELYALYLAYRDPRVPLHAKIFAALVVGYAFSPIDLIPDFIPIIGYLDDLILIPLGVALALKMIPPDVMDECRTRSLEFMAAGKPKNLIAAIIIVAVWIFTAITAVILIRRIF